MKRLLYLMLSLSLLVVGCSKDKDNDELDPETKTTTYTFGPRWYDQIENIDQIKASADSVQVGKIIFQATNLSETGDSIYGWWGVNMRTPYNKLTAALNAAKNKGECRGTLKRVSDGEINREYAPKLEALGLKIIFDIETEAAQ